MSTVYLLFVLRQKRPKMKPGVTESIKTHFE